MGMDHLKSYNELLDREGYFCDICGHEANGPEGLKQFASVEGEVLNICKNKCLSDE
jgi:ribosome-binding protein aMBF1 (putative translation factor)